MGLELIIDSLDKVDETIKGLYIEQDGKFMLDVMGMKKHPSIVNLQGAIGKERDARKLSDKSLKEMKDLTDGLDLESLKGIDPEKYTKALDSLEKFKSDEKKRNNKKLKDKEQWEKLGQQLQDDFNDKLDELQTKHDQKIAIFQTKLDDVNKTNDKKLSSMMESLEKELKNKEIITAIADAKGNRVVLMPHISQFVKIVEEDSGEFAARVIDGKGIVRINDAGDPMAISEFVEELKEKEEFKGEGIFAKKGQSGGSGSDGNQGGDDNGDKNPFSKDSFNLTEQGKLYKKDPAEYKRLKALADKKKG